MRSYGDCRGHAAMEEDHASGVGGGGGGGFTAPAPFLTKTYDMVDDLSTNSVVSWSGVGHSFVVWRPVEFARDLLPKYFKHNNFSSFVRQLNTYGFKKVDPDQWEFANEEFIRGQKHMLKNIHRRKPIHSHSLHHQGASGQVAEAERHELEEEIERLKREKSMLDIELQKYKGKQNGMHTRMHHLEERLQNVELRQKSIIDFLSQIVQKPCFFSNFIQPYDVHSKKRRLLKTGYFSEDIDVEDRQMVPAIERREAADCSSIQLLDSEPFDKIESSINSLEAFLRGVSLASGGELCFDSPISSPPSGVIITEIHASSSDTYIHMNSPPLKLQPTSPSMGDVHSSPEFAESTSPVEGPGLALLEVHPDTRTKRSEIDVNSDPAAPDHTSQDRTTETPSTAAPIGVNDVFWEQFLRETPGSTDTQEVQSERRDTIEKRTEVKVDGHSGVWWNKKKLDHLTEQMGHLTSAEKT